MKYLFVGCILTLIITVICFIANALSLFVNVTGFIGFGIWISSIRFLTDSFKDVSSTLTKQNKELRFKSSSQYFLLGLPLIIGFFIGLKIS